MIDIRSINNEKVRNATTYWNKMFEGNNYPHATDQIAKLRDLLSSRGLKAAVPSAQGVIPGALDMPFDVNDVVGKIRMEEIRIADANAAQKIANTTNISLKSFLTRQNKPPETG